MVKAYVEKVFGTRSDRVIKKLRPAISRINQLESQFAALSDDDLRAQTAVFKEKLDNGANVDSLLAPALPSFARRASACSICAITMFSLLVVWCCMKAKSQKCVRVKVRQLGGDLAGVPQRAVRPRRAFGDGQRLLGAS